MYFFICVLWALLYLVLSTHNTFKLQRSPTSCWNPFIIRCNVNSFYFLNYQDLKKLNIVFHVMSTLTCNWSDDNSKINLTSQHSISKYQILPLYGSAVTMGCIFLYRYLDIESDYSVAFLKFLLRCLSTENMIWNMICRQ